jgi:hypothetical protein
MKQHGHGHGLDSDLGGREEHDGHGYGLKQDLGLVQSCLGWGRVKQQHDLGRVMKQHGHGHGLESDSGQGEKQHADDFG